MASTHSTWARKLWLSLKGLHRLRFPSVWIHWVLLFSSAAVQSWLPLSSTSVTEEKVVGETKLCGFQERLFLYTRGWKLNNWITIIHYSLFFPKLFIIHVKFFRYVHYSFFEFLYQFSFPKFSTMQFYTLFIKRWHFSIHSTLSLASTILFFL